MKKGVINVQLVYCPAFLSCNNKKAFDGSKLDYRRENLSKVHTFLLSVTTNNQVSLIPLNGSIRSLFDLIDPLTRNGLLMRRKRDDVPCMISLQGLKFLNHGFLPSWMASNLVVKLWFMKVKLNRGDP